MYYIYLKPYYINIIKMNDNEIKYKIGFVYVIKPINIIEGNESDIYFGSTLKQNICFRMVEHIYNFKTYEKTGHKFISSYILFKKYGIEELLIEVVETLKDCTLKELHDKETFYISSSNCVNIKGKTKEETKEKISDDDINKLIMALGFINSSILLSRTELKNNFGKCYKNMELYTKKIIKFKFNDTISTKGIMGHLNNILKVYSMKITTKQQRIKGMSRTSNKESFYFISML
jgi:hypothetical protein